MAHIDCSIREHLTSLHQECIECVVLPLDEVTLEVHLSQLYTLLKHTTYHVHSLILYQVLGQVQVLEVEIILELT
jgi:hypothetical protein